MTDSEPPAEAAPTVTILDRVLGAGFDEATARARIVEGGVRVDGEVVTDPAASAPKPAKWVFGPQ